MTILALLITGYHASVEDNAIYLPGIKKLLNPRLYPFDAQFFSSQTNPFPLVHLVAGFVRFTHLPLEWIQFAWHLFSVFSLLAGCWYLARQLFSKFWERLGAVALVSALLSMPVAGTALYICDQYFHPRTLATAAILFAIAALLRRQFGLAALFSLLALLAHPFMGAFGIALLVVLALPLERWHSSLLAALPWPFILHPNDGWRQAFLSRGYFSLRRWEWYEWLGVFAPMLILLGFSYAGRKLASPSLTRLCRRLVVYSAVMSVAGLIVGIPAQLDWLAPIQPMRYLQLVYLLMVLAGGGLLARFALQNRVWLWLALYLPLCAGMFYAQRALFPTSPHLELPGRSTANRWVHCFQWIQRHTPQDAYFAINPQYMSSPGEENFGFRAIAERSQLADYSKDAAVVAVAPDLGPSWKSQVDAARNYETFTRQNFLRLRSQFGVDWALVETTVPGLPCPYQHDGLFVCRIE